MLNNVRANSEKREKKIEWWYRKETNRERERKRIKIQKI